MSHASQLCREFFLGDCFELRNGRACGIRLSETKSSYSSRTFDESGSVFTFEYALSVNCVVCYGIYVSCKYVPLLKYCPIYIENNMDAVQAFAASCCCR